MPLVTLNEILPQARAERRAVCAFNVVNCESAKAALMAAEAEDQPVILQVFHRLFGDDKARYVGALVRDLADHSDLPVVLHLDHGQTIEHVKMAVEYGFTSAMFDGSKLPLAENIAQTRTAAQIAHEGGLTIEAEIGHIPTTATEDLPLSTPEEAAEFADATNVDALAVAIGTAHGFYKSAPIIHTDLARRISEKVAIPLVLHGGSDTPEDKVREAIACGFAKLNIATEFFNVFLEQVVRESENRGDSFIPIDLFMNPVTDAMAAFAATKVRMAAGTDT
ncbi:MAG: class II fructose-bisphosphate aldolase [Lentisphaerae bacterium]|jgi:fructose-bisphosphate aldolase, class II|nr:class II fructose-bisphosphate aldolase [Lentisphaerota bacterium]MBT4820522.1 class II fructose-bisphosphate aldolase [Lentisphaerota bacterium]MBT5607328.1 class II fructose-bisphosphate aldolase [Lentisphaerota bacterium]MBT7055354.1 class II fructose-bisphosphate aldolase [Lentisphaerota bacterium]MBT7844562.1 class II fructose-bisphosphate aldolase [Lentisphaerota bacterium]